MKLKIKNLTNGWRTNILSVVLEQYCLLEPSFRKEGSLFKALFSKIVAFGVEKTDCSCIIVDVVRFLLRKELQIRLKCTKYLIAR